MRKLIVLGVLITATGLLYAGDYLSLHYRAAHPTANDPFESVQFFYATQLKSGKVEIFFGQPGTEICVHSLFPHRGDLPCWYVKRQSNIHLE